jgi:hypothetical protein
MITIRTLIRSLGFGPKFDAQSTLASEAERYKTKQTLDGYAGLTQQDGDAAEFIFRESKSAYDLARDRLKILDGKAGTLIGIVTTGFGAIAILGDPARVPSHGFWLYVSLFFLAVAFVFGLLSLAPRGANSPDLSYYVLDEILHNPANTVRIKFDLAQAWLRDAASVEFASIVKGSRLLAGTVALFFGIIALAVNYITAAPGEKPVPTIKVILQPSESPTPK